VDKRAKIITITSRKGGVGKTAITSLLARYFTEVEGKKVLGGMIVNQSRGTNWEKSYIEKYTVETTEQGLRI
jgi:CO dehydrogenase nickel-insertion accessory protein CooC1